MDERQLALGALLAGEDPQSIAADWQDVNDSFIGARKKYLLY